MDNFEKSNDSALDVLKKQLENADIDVSEWGKG